MTPHASLAGLFLFYTCERSYQFVEDLVQALELALFPELIVVVAATQNVNQEGGERRGRGRAAGWSFRTVTSDALHNRPLFRHKMNRASTCTCTALPTITIWNCPVG